VIIVFGAAVSFQKSTMKGN